MDRRSILWQIHLYRTGGKPLFIDADELIRGGKGKWSYLDLKWLDILYSMDFFLFFKSGLRGTRRLSDVERECDEYLGAFIYDRYKEGDYVSKYREALTPLVRGLILSRALMATFNTTGPQMNRVHKSRRAEIIKKMNLSPQISAKSSAEIFYHYTSRATIEEQILGRIGYLILWKDLKDEAS